MAIKISSDTIFGSTSAVFNSATVVGGVASGPNYKFQGEVSGYTSGGVSVSAGTLNTIDKFSFAADADATDVGNLTATRNDLTGQSSNFFGYTSGGSTPSDFNIIDKFPFVTDTGATDVGDLTLGRSAAAGQSSTESGYTSGGNPSNPNYTNTIDKFPFSADADATGVGILTQARKSAAGQSSSDYGYTSGGLVVPPASPTYVNTIDKFPFASDADATDVGVLTQNRMYNAGQSSSESGYTSGGLTPPLVNTIDKFPFASDADATDVGDLTVSRYWAAGQSSSKSGYTSGGTSTAPPSTFPYYDTIDKFPFVSDADATDVGNLTQSRRGAAGQQY